MAGWVGTVAVGGAFVVACIVLAGLLGLPDNGRVVVDNYFTWFSAGGLSVPVGTLVDPLSMTMCMFITFVSAFIHLYSIGYMKGDRDYTKFFIYLNLFVFSMLLLVLADNLLLTFVGWEGVGVCSYWLVAFWFQRESAASAGKKAFIYNRIGDVGFLLAIFLIFEKTGTIQYESGPGGGIFGQLSHLGGARPPPRCCCCSWPPRGSRPRSRCSTGCPTPWRARPRSRPSSTPPPWSRPGSTCCAG